jgi:DNA gyrase subunit A
MDVVRALDTDVLVVTSNGYSKRTPIEAYRQQGRYGQGIQTIQQDERTGPIVAMCCVNSKDDILVLTESGLVMRTGLDEIRLTGRKAIGVRLMHLSRNDQIAGIAIMDGEDAVSSDELNDGNGAELNGSEPPLIDGQSVV